MAELNDNSSFKLAPGSGGNTRHQKLRSFEEYGKEEDGVHYWLARDLMGLLGYKKWENFYDVIKKAATACSNSGNAVQEHWLPAVRKSISGKGKEVGITDFYYLALEFPPTPLTNKPTVYSPFHASNQTLY